MQRKLGIIGGTNLYRLGGEGELLEVAETTPYGIPSSPVQTLDVKGYEVPVIIRHGLEHNIPPHRVNHPANLHTLKDAGVTHVLGISSTGSLRTEIRPPRVLIPEDFFSPFVVPTIYNDTIVHVTPELDEQLREYLREAAERTGVDVYYGGVYVQSTGPRLESKAEIRVMKEWGHVVGMSMASEATVAVEMGLKYASLCSVDNYAHGVEGEKPDYQSILEAATRNWRSIEAILEALLEIFYS
ncbi:MAG: MTAP family purine nucleoside phosphorylase [Thermoplasmata archaeon]|nr:MTAP family purine nucleoside phosphorylase [Thermoplasmata archaeon]OYT49595.1 MAG: 6-oxopurine nucleoside phosphorylase [Thermoplasmatales archaeon ex4484_36]HDD60414.1 6-oxopurine nucleoside phosphorylase [Euryarchaeota archaeon]RLF54887.1 MAG: 6-oxopurine nucleoside phosphorylase [Thermoplasmata archaeon]RLF70756.1 MAG: 6-oxopurine nucleoside phosphorylase [Thermoplasmata archaeon]